MLGFVNTIPATFAIFTAAKLGKVPNLYQVFPIAPSANGIFWIDNDLGEAQLSMLSRFSGDIGFTLTSSGVRVREWLHPFHRAYP